MIVNEIIYKCRLGGVLLWNTLCPYNPNARAPHNSLEEGAGSAPRRPQRQGPRGPLGLPGVEGSSGGLTAGKGRGCSLKKPHITCNTDCSAIT